MRIFNVRINNNWFSFVKLYIKKIISWIKESGKYIFAFLITGGIVDIFVKNGMVWLTVDNLDNYCLGLIQIQATMTTLIIATIALLSGILNKSYLGISLCSFILDIKPNFLKFMNVLIYEFVLLGFTIILYTFECYNSVIIICVYSIFILPFFIKNVYSAFANPSDILGEIKKYYLYLVKENNDYKYIGEKFIEDWKKAVIHRQSKEDFREYFQLFMKLIIRIVSKDKDLKTVNAFSEIMAIHLLNNENYEIKLTGVYYVFDFYAEINKWLSKNQNVANNIPGQISLLSKVYRSFWGVIKSLSTEDIEKLSFRIFFVNVLTTAVIFRSKDINELSDLNTLQVISGSLGYLLDNQYRRVQTVNSPYWRTLIINSHIEYNCLKDDISHDLKKVYYETLAKINFNICKSYLMCGYIDYIKNSVFSDMSGYTTILEYEQDKREAIILEIMLIHCFMYYLAYREKYPHISNELQQKVKSLIEDKHVIEIINKIYCTIANIFSKDLSFISEQKLENILDKCELFDTSTGGAIKVVTMPDAVKDYYLYIILWLAIKSWKKFDVSKYLELDKYYSYLFNGYRKSVENHLVELNALLNDWPSDSEINLMFDIFNKDMKGNFKRKLISDASLNYKKLEESNAKERIRKRLKQYFYNSFGENSSVCAGSTKEKLEVSFTVKDFTEILIEDVNHAYITYMFGLVNRKLVDELIKTFGVEFKNFNTDFKDSSSIISYIQNRKYNLFIGNSAIILNNLLKLKGDYKQCNDFINSMNKNEIPEADYVVSTNEGEFFICLNDIDVNIVPLSLETMDSQDYTRKSEKQIEYKYSNQVTLDFMEDEFNQFIGYFKQLVRVTLSFSIIPKNTDNRISATLFDGARFL